MIIGPGITFNGGMIFVEEPNLATINLTNLIVWLDSSNTSSYPGSGTTWTDLSGNAKNMTLTNGPTFESANANSIVFDGTNDYALSASSLYTMSSFPTISTFIWWYPQAAGQIVSELGQGTINSGWHDSQIEINSSGQISFAVWDNYADKIVSSAKSFNTWYNLGFTYNNATSTTTAYINGVSIGSVVNPRSTYSAIYYTIAGIDGTNMGTNAYGKGKCGAFYHYTRALSATEVLNNYNSNKARFGL
jgi:hypothetical protein